MILKLRTTAEWLVTLAGVLLVLEACTRFFSTVPESVIERDEVIIIVPGKGSKERGAKVQMKRAITGDPEKGSKKGECPFQCPLKKGGKGDKRRAAAALA